MKSRTSRCFARESYRPCSRKKEHRLPDTQSVIAVELHASLLEVCDKIRLQAELSRTVNELYSQFNIPGSGAIVIDALGADAPQQRPFQLKINDRTAPYS